MIAEPAKIEAGRNIPTTIGLFLLTVGLFCTVFFMPFQLPATLLIGLGWGTLYFVSVLRRGPFSHSREPRQELQKRMWSVIASIAGTGWFAYLGNEYLSRGKKGSAIFFATVGVCAAFFAAWEASGLLRMKKKSA